MIRIRSAVFSDEASVARTLFHEYAAGLGLDLTFQNFEAELAALPGEYAPPRGRLLLAWRGEDALGCVALRPLDETTCEMKRLYVWPGACAEGPGRGLAERLVVEAQEAGFTRMVLDPLGSMTEAVRLYEQLGFHRTEPYVFNPLPGPFSWSWA